MYATTMYQIYLSITLKALPWKCYNKVYTQCEHKDDKAFFLSFLASLQ